MKIFSKIEGDETFYVYAVTPMLPNGESQSEI